MPPIMKYLENEKLPNDLKKARRLRRMAT